MQALVRSFSAEHLLKTRALIRTVPVTPEVMKEILHKQDLGDLAPTQTLRIPTIVRYQELIPEAARMLKKEGGHNLDMHSFGMRYVERFDIPLNEYQRLNRMTFGEDEPFDAPVLYRFLHVGTVRLLEESYDDQALADVLRDAVRSMITFTQSHGEMLDIAGSGNVRVFKDAEGKWTYLIIDPFADNEWTGARDVAQRLFASGNVNHDEAYSLLNALNYARALNGMARILGVKERLSFIPQVENEMDHLSETLLHRIRSAHHWPDRRIFSPARELEKTPSKNIHRLKS
jgi:hypothetical protein